MENTIIVEALVNAPIQKVWEFYNDPQHVVQWNNASADWHTTSAVNDLSVGGTFSYRMEAKDGSFGFNFGGTYNEVVPQERIVYILGDGRRVEVVFKEQGSATHVAVTFEAEKFNTLEKQQSGWQAILDNFKAHTENNLS